MLNAWLRPCGKGLLRKLFRVGSRLCGLTPRNRAVEHEKSVVRLYEETMGRGPVPREILGWVCRLNTRWWRLDHVRDSLCKSGEYESIVKPIMAEIRATYSKYLLREPTSGEIASHLSHFEAKWRATKPASR